MDSLASDEFYYVETLYFTCGIMVHDRKVIDAAPIMKWSIGKWLSEVQEWANRKGGNILLVN